MTPEPWLAARTDGAPVALSERVQAWAALTDPHQPLPMRLVDAGQSALEAVVHSGQDRSVALDLLAADALITLALLAQADREPGALQEFARRIRVGMRTRE